MFSYRSVFLFLSLLQHFLWCQIKDFALTPFSLLVFSICCFFALYKNYSNICTSCPAVPLKTQNVFYSLLYFPEYITTNTHSTSIINESPEPHLFHILCLRELLVYQLNQNKLCRYVFRLHSQS